MTQETVAPPSAAPAFDVVEGTRQRGAVRSFVRYFLRRKLGVLSLAYISLFYFTAVFAPLLAPYHYTEQNLDAALQGPSREHLFGTDRLGRDMFSRVIYATRTTMLITVITVITGSLIIGPVLGLIAGYSRGVVDSLINRIGEVISGLPSLLIIIVFAASLGPRMNNWIANYYDLPLIGESLRGGFGSLLVLSAILTALGWVGEMRFVRAQTLQLRSEEYILAAQATGAGTWRIIRRHIVPNLGHFIVLGVAGAFGAVALSEIALSFLGLGVRPPVPTFGEMISSGAGPRTLQAHPSLLFIPGTVAILLLLSWALLADALNDVLNPRTRSN